MLVQVEQDDPLWSTEPPMRLAKEVGACCAVGAFVVLYPPAGQAGEALKKRFEAAGARVVELRASPAPRIVVAGESPAGHPAAEPVHRGIRAVVAQVVAEANTRDRSALEAVVESALAGAGL